MRLSVIASFGLCAIFQLASAGPQPELNYDENTAKDCGYWYDNIDNSYSCKYVRDGYGISPEDFTKWNPMIDHDCNGWGRRSYCVMVKSQMTSTTTTTTTTSSSTPTTTVLRATPTAWDYLGCYQDTDSHPLTNKSSTIGGTGFTISKCEESCYRDGFNFVGVKSGTECWCSNSVRSSWTDNQDDCDVVCATDDSLSCGGADVFAVYKANVPLGGNPITVTHTTTSPTSTKSHPATVTSTAPASASHWVPRGCYLDTYPAHDRTLEKKVLSSDQHLTIEKCQDKCREANYLYAGVEDGAECWCGNSIQSPNDNTITDGLQCKKPCSGDSSQTCGNSGYIQLYETSAPKIEWTSQGCYLDTFPAHDRTLEKLSLDKVDHLNVKACQVYCQIGHYMYAGVENGNECWCGNSIQSPENNKPTDSSSCNKPCSGNANQTCGSSGHIGIYKASQPAFVWQSDGCYLDTYPAHSRILSNLIIDHPPGLTTEMCQYQCLKNGYYYAGLEDGQECWCGNVLQSPDNNKPTNSKECNRGCTGTTNESCGGYGRATIYKAVEKDDSGSWDNLGCYSDSFPAHERTLKHVVMDGVNDLTIENCQAKCHKSMYTYAGVEDGRECWCGNDIQSPANNKPAGLSQCNKSCTGDNSKTCGASGFINLFQYKKKQSESWVPMGCYTEEDPRILHNKIAVPGGQDNTTPQRCIDTCNAYSYSYAGVENGNECWCDDVNHGKLASDGEQACKSPCTGDASKTCGGNSRLNVYKKLGSSK